jgi:hypothetical protein
MHSTVSFVDVLMDQILMTGLYESLQNDWLLKQKEWDVYVGSVDVPWQGLEPLNKTMRI